jgi:DNA modification methylase
VTAPYYQDEHVTLYHGDALDEDLVAEWQPADVLITDPPYGIDYSGFGGRAGEPARARGRQSIVGDLTTAARDDVLALWGELKPAVVFGRWDMRRPERVRARLIWDKTPCGFMGDTALPWGAAEEEIYVIGDGFRGSPRVANILRYPTLMSNDARRPAHPTPKPVPVPLMMHLLERAPAGLVADPFAGSGSTLVAAAQLRRKAVGVEIEERYCELLAGRLSQQTFDLDGLGS